MRDPSNPSNIVTSLTNPSSTPAQGAYGAPSLAALQRVDRLAKVLDEAFTLPFTRIKVGLDSMIGLIPGIGDFAGLAIGGYLIFEAHRMGAPSPLKWQMARNTAIDAVAGLVPGLGDAVDLIYRSNRRNLELLRGHFRPLEAKTLPTRPRWLPWLLCLAALAGTGYVLWLWW